MKKCPLFDKCGGCKFDFSSDSYKAEKFLELNSIPDLKDPVWIKPGNRRRADFAFLENTFGFYEKNSKNIVPIKRCPLLTEGLNNFLPRLKFLPWIGSGDILITELDNGIDIAVTSSVPYFSSDFKNAAEKSKALRITWNEKLVYQEKQPLISFGDKAFAYPSGAFLQPSKAGEDILRKIVLDNTKDATKTADLFCGIGSFTYSLNAVGFDIEGIGVKRDLFKKPLSVGELKKFDCVVMDPPRAGAFEQSKTLAKSDVKKVIYISCNPRTFIRDKRVLEQGNFKLLSITPLDQFVGSEHWELAAIFDNKSA